MERSPLLSMIFSMDLSPSGSLKEVAEVLSNKSTKFLQKFVNQINNNQTTPKMTGNDRQKNLKELANIDESCHDFISTDYFLFREKSPSKFCNDIYIDPDTADECLAVKVDTLSLISSKGDCQRSCHSQNSSPSNQSTISLENYTTPLEPDVGHLDWVDSILALETLQNNNCENTAFKWLR